MSAARVLFINVGVPRVLVPDRAGSPFDKPWTTGFFKQPVRGPVWLGGTNLAGDGQADLQNHGGPDKAVSVYPSEHGPRWCRELGLDDLPPGGFGENFTTAGLLEDAVCVGDVFQIGPATVQVSQPRQPCWKLARRWRIRNLAARVQQTGRTGWYLRVLQEGMIEPGLPLTLIERPHPEWTIAACNAVMHQQKQDTAAARALAACPALSASWRATLQRRGGA